MTVSMGRRSSLVLIGLTVLLCVHMSSGQFQFGRNNRNNNNRLRKRFFPDPNHCNKCDPTTTGDSDIIYPDPTPAPLPWPNPSLGKQVKLLEIAETCAANFVTQDFDKTWEAKHWEDIGFGGIGEDRWVVRLSNRLFVYLMAFNMFQTNGLDITDSQLEKSACFATHNVNGWSITNTTGFAGKSVMLRLVQTNMPQVYRFTLPYGPLGASTGTASLILSDNKSNNVFEFCFDNGLRTFAMFSKTLKDEYNDMKAVKLHLKALGFKEKHFIDLDPKFNCDNYPFTGMTPKTGEWDLPSPRPLSAPLLKFVGHNSLLPVPPLFWKKK